MKKYVKLFDSESYGQILVIRDYRDEDEKELVKFCVSIDGAVQELIAVTDSVDDADKILDRVTLETAEAAVKELVDAFSGLNE